VSPLPPLVEPAAQLTRDEVARYSRHLIIPDLGVDGQKRLKNARVLVIGAGGLGSPTLLYLAAAGVGTIGIVEFDVVDESNLQRQIIHGQSDIGRSKAQSARDSVLEINPLVEVRLHEVRLDESNAVELFEQYDLILDGTDNFATRYLVNDAAVLAGKPYVWGSIYRFEGQVSVFWEDAPDGLGLNYRDLYPEPPPPGMVPSCAEGGVHRGHQADHRHRRPAAGPADGVRRARHDLPHHQDPQGSRDAEDHRADRLRGVLRCRLG
jgi:adenylyltransferase/sulfurtransferase